jgi:uncharacterized protein
MIVKHHAINVAKSLHRDISGIRRVLITRTDGLTFYDDDPDSDHDSAAAIAATVLGIAHQSAFSFGLGGFQLATVRGPEGCLVVYAVDQRHILAVVTEPNVNLVLLDRIAMRLARELAEVESGTHAPVGY